MRSKYWIIFIFLLLISCGGEKNNHAPEIKYNHLFREYILSQYPLSSSVTNEGYHEDGSLSEQLITNYYDSANLEIVHQLFFLSKDDKLGIENYYYKFKQAAPGETFSLYLSKEPEFREWLSQFTGFDSEKLPSTNAKFNLFDGQDSGSQIVLQVTNGNIKRLEINRLGDFSLLILKRTNQTLLKEKIMYKYP